MSSRSQNMDSNLRTRGADQVSAGTGGRPSAVGRMQALLRAVWVLMAALTLAGCVPRYKITLTNGNMITTRGKPKFDAENNVYRFKDARGVPGYVPAFRVKEIAPL